MVQREVEGKLGVELQASDGRQVISLGVVEQVLEQDLGGLDRRGLSGPQPLVDFHHRLFLGRRPFPIQRIEDHRRGGGGVEVHDLKALHSAFQDLVERSLAETLVLVHDLLFGALVNLAPSRTIGSFPPFSVTSIAQRWP